MCLCSLPALADTVSFPGTISVLDIPESGVIATVDLPRFDPLLGILQSVHVVIEADFAGDMRFENLDTQLSKQVTLELTWLAELYLPPGDPNAASTPILDVSDARVRARLFGPYDNALDYAGSSGATYNVAATNVAAAGLLTTDLDPFIGSGDIAIGVAAQRTYDVTVVYPAGSTTYDAVAENVQFNGDLTITYTYIVPEPVTSTLCVVTLLVFRRRR